MLRDIIFKGKELADKVTNIMMNYTEAELKVREATNDEMCCPHGRLLQKLADYTYTYETYLEVMSTLWKRMHPDDRCSWRRVYKSLVVLSFLLKNGSDYVLQGARDHIYDIRTLESFRYFDDNGKDQGMNVRIKVQEIIDLIQDPEKLQQERQKAKASRHIYTGYGNTNDSDWSYSSYRNSANHGQRSESNPRMVSEEVYEFPSNAVESGGTYEAKLQSSYEDYSAQNKFQSTNSSKSIKCSSIDTHVNNSANNNGDGMHATQSNGKSVGQVIVKTRNQSTDKKDNKKPRPPSCDLFDSFTDNSVNKSDQMIDFDTICSLSPPTTTSVHSHQQQPVQMGFEINWPENMFSTPGVSLNTNSFQNHTTMPRQDHDHLLDNEFGDFTSASSLQSPMFPVTTGSTISSSSFDDIFLPNSSSAQPYPSNQNSHQIKQTEEFKQQQMVQSNPTSPSKSKPLNIGNTWKELASLSIDLDSLAKPEKYNTRTQAPSLHQLKQNQRVQ
ncbi:unnamed protein product [Schistosoma turkestanicum]|nr:unnamed protein product [Schistosoma turkestanicum]